MNNPTCPQCDCVARCQANPALCPNVSAIAQPVHPSIKPVALYTADVDLANKRAKEEAPNTLARYITANYPNAEGDTLTDRVIFALETMDIALGMKEIAQPVQPTDNDFDRALRKHETNCCMFERGVQTLDDVLRSREAFIKFAQSKDKP